MFTVFNKKTPKETAYAQELQIQRDLALTVTDLAYTKQVANFFNANGIQAEILKPTCRFAPNLRLNMNGTIVVAKTIKAPTLLDVKDIRAYFSIAEVYKAGGLHKLPNPISNVPYIITNIGFTTEAELEAKNRGLVLHFQPITQPQAM